jgi:endonuclease/exonuclease/phosphatase family metal-dependent hydrolase
MKPPSFKVVTLNLLNDLSRWEARQSLLIQGVSALDPDIIALQEVALPNNNAKWLAEELNQAMPGRGLYTHYLCPKTGSGGGKEGIAILSRLPVEGQVALDLRTQHRVAQYLRVQIGDESLIFTNGHFFWQPGESYKRLKQVELLLEWLGEFTEQLPLVICGDFNGTPQTAAIRRMRQDFTSAYAAVHGHEPAYTAPTPLARSRLSKFRSILGFLRYIRIKEIDLNWHGTIDYIFVNRFLRVLDCQLVLDQPDPANPSLYASDHFGLSATFEIKQ